MRILFKGGLVYGGGSLCRLDVLVAGGRVEQLGENLADAQAKVVDAAGCVLAPGFTDLHVHLREPGQQAKETVATGTAAAAAGGFTTVCAMPNLSPVPDSPEHLAPQLAAIGRDAAVRVLPYGALSVGEQGEALADIAGTAGAVCGYSDDGRGVQSEDVMRTAMAEAAKTGRFVAAHCEVNALLPADGVTIQPGAPLAEKYGWQGCPNESEWREVERDIALAGETGCRLHVCHTSAAQSFELVRAAKARGLPVTCEVSPHNLLLACEDISEDNGRYRMNPPLRNREDVTAAVNALLDGTVDAVATDHAPHTAAEKDGPFGQSANGVVGLETAFPVLYTKLALPGAVPLEKLLWLLCEGPRGVLLEAPNRIAAGEVADLVLLDLQTERKVELERFLSKGRSTPFAGWALRGWPILTMYNGNIVFQHE